MPSKKRLAISIKQPEQPKFFTDRNLGSSKLALQLRDAGFDITVHDDIYQETERDPWIFYQRGKQGMVVITSDREFMKFFPHMAAIELGRTKVIAFTHNNFNSDVRGKAFIKARRRILAAASRYKDKSFIAVVGMEGTFRIVDDSPRPNRKQCDGRDWDSYERVCSAEGRLFLIHKQEDTA